MCYNVNIYMLDTFLLIYDVNIYSNVCLYIKVNKVC